MEAKGRKKTTESEKPKNETESDKAGAKKKEGVSSPRKTKTAKVNRKSVNNDAIAAKPTKSTRQKKDRASISSTAEIQEKDKPADKEFDSWNEKREAKKKSKEN
jgi:hypothetical protein